MRNPFSIHQLNNARDQISGGGGTVRVEQADQRWEVSAHARVGDMYFSAAHLVPSDASREQVEFTLLEIVERINARMDAALNAEAAPVA
jgi:hypothetical protein